MKIYIGGNNGVGKSTLAKLFVQENELFKQFFSSEVIMKTHNLKSREEMKCIEINNDLIGRFYSQFDNLIVDGHFYLKDYEKK